ncbi:GMP synthase [Hyalangium minutum]|uniref:GMP synthase n=1 Tax=Hyalangium minutum TaxID=394096 RepID=A0A085W4Y0_9BACT|nr:GMP synthase [Hyalangium minutum]
MVFEHDEDAGLAHLGPALQQAGFTLVRRFRTTKREDVDAELVVVMGGHMGVYEADQHPFLKEEIALLSERLANERPCLGICLGAQMLAAAAGAEVFLGKNGLEAGALPVRWTQEGMKDPVIAGVKPRTVMAHWHQDTFKAVPGATLLASTDRYTQQAFRLGKSYGFQFHMELGAEDLDRWLTQWKDTLAKHGKTPEELRTQVPKLKAAQAELTELQHRLAHHFAKAVR